MIIESVLNDIQTVGFSIQQKIFQPDLISKLRTEILDAYHNNSLELKAAGVGKNANLELQIRGDKIQWLTEEKLTESQKIVWDFLETLKVQFNQKLFLGLNGFETHMTVYPIGTFYKKHVDQFQNSTSSKIRKISFVIYLNEDWQESHGGELNLFDPMATDKVLVKILPVGGHVIFFLSHEFPHEVCEPKKERLSMTGWFYI